MIRVTFDHGAVKLAYYNLLSQFPCCMICTVLNDLCYVEWIVLRLLNFITLMIVTTLNDPYGFEWSLLHSMICIMLNDL